MNKQGFTLIELLSTIVVIGLVMSIVLPSAYKIQRENKIRMYKEYEKMMVEYVAVSDYKDQLYVELDQLEELDKVKKECDGYVWVDHSKDILDYKAYVSCGNVYETEGYNDRYSDNTISIPTCKENLYYDGTEQVLVFESSQYTLSNEKRTDIGKQNVTASINDKKNAKWIDNTRNDKIIDNCEIKKRPITLTVDDVTINYGSKIPTFIYKLSNAIVGENPLNNAVTYIVKNSNGEVVDLNTTLSPGTYSIIPYASVVSNYSLNIVNGTLTIVNS